jgi:hypothetical protein
MTTTPPGTDDTHHHITRDTSATIASRFILAIPHGDTDTMNAIAREVPCARCWHQLALIFETATERVIRVAEGYSELDQT